jgi:hypothetical protein
LNSESDRQPRAETQRWQRQMLPTMTRMVVALTVFFFAASLAQLLYLHWCMRAAPEPQLDSAQAVLTSVADTERLDAYRLEAAVALELHALERRYHQANVLLMSRVWTRYLGFVTGMILSLVGAVFVLGKLRTPTTQMELAAAPFKYSIQSASPGLIMILLGVALMLTTIVTHHRIDVVDTAIFTSKQNALWNLADGAPDLGDLE